MNNALPKPHVDVVIAVVTKNGNRRYDTTWLTSDNEWTSPLADGAEVTHWMPLDPPKDSE